MLSPRTSRPSSILRSLQLSTPMVLPHAVFAHVAKSPIKLLVVPANPTMPSSKLPNPSAAQGAMLSQRSEISCICVAR